MSTRARVLLVLSALSTLLATLLTTAAHAKRLPIQAHSRPLRFRMV
jgi:hypothetical protein